MPPRKRQFVLACLFLVGVHAGAAGVLWMNGSGPEPPAPQTATTDADPVTLLQRGAHNDATFAKTSTVQETDPDTGTVISHVNTTVDPAVARARVTAVSEQRSVVAGNEQYITGWGTWVRAGDRWQYESNEPPGSRYESSSVRYMRPAPETARSLQTTEHDNGSVTIQVTDSNPGGALSPAGPNATVTYRIAFQADRPYIAFARAVPAGEGNIVTVRQQPGATVSRPAALPRATAQEAIDRLLTGGVAA